MKELRNIIENTGSWQDIYAKLIMLDANSAGRLFEQFCKYYFLSEPSLQSEYRGVWLFNELPLNVREKLNLGKIDHGVDLVLEDQTGAFSVVQCKFKRDQSSSISWTRDKLANLFADGDKADYFIIFTNASQIDKHSLSKKENQLKTISLGDLLNISQETIEQIRNLLSGNQIRLKLKAPRDYQETAITKVVEGFAKHDRGQLILPCGTGKTLISLWLHERLNPQHTIVLFPSLALLKQTKNEWAANRQEYMPYICVCSEKDIDKGSDTTKVNTHEIIGNVTTDANEIERFLRTHSKTILFSTYQSLKAICEAAKNLGFKFDLAICDEAHKVSGNKQGSFGLIHDDANIQIRNRLYMTATPKVVSDDVKNQLQEHDLKYLYDMSNPKVFGPEFYRMSFKEAIDKGILVDYKIVAVGISNLALANAIQERQYVNDGETVDELANNYALQKFMGEHDSSHAITFHSSVAKAESFQTRHKKFCPEMDIYHVNGKQTTNERNVLINEFKQSPKSILTNAKCLTEGIDVPIIDTVYFCDPKNSKIDIVQAAGRALRRSDGKQLGYIVVPVFHTETTNVEEIIEEGPFKNLISVVRALSGHDERLVEEIQNIKLGKGKKDDRESHIDLTGSLELITLEGFTDSLKEDLFNQIISKIRIPWRSFEDAREYVHALNLKSQAEWVKYRKNPEKPQDIPAGPQITYKNSGWISWGDWLGTGRIADQYKTFLPIEDARILVHSLGLKSRKEWKEYCKSNKKPENFPADPQNTYAEKGWVSWGNWLGYDYISFEEARKYVHSLGLKTEKEWKEYCDNGRRPNNIPASPSSVYKNKGWVSWGNWLGNGKRGRPKNIRGFASAREFARTLQFKGKSEWSTFTKSTQIPDDIPSTPDRVYKNKGWVSWGDWLGSGVKATYYRKYIPFAEARSFAHTLKLKNKDAWISYSKRGNKPDDIPACPRTIYQKEGWVSWGDWLGSGKIANQCKEYKSFYEARQYVRQLKLKRRKEWDAYCKSGDKPNDIPAAPWKTYKEEGWRSVADWLRK